MQDLRLGHRIVYDVKANWKLIIQNYNECLHCPNLHPALNKLSHYLSGENEPLQPTYMGGRMDLRPGVSTLSMDGTCPRAFLPGCSPRTASRLLLRDLPEHAAQPAPGLHDGAHAVAAVAPDRTINICEWHFHPAELARAGFDAVGRDRLLGHDEPAGLARLRAVAGGDLVARLHAGAVLESRGSAVRVRPDDRGTALLIGFGFYKVQRGSTTSGFGKVRRGSTGSTGFFRFYGVRLGSRFYRVERVSTAR